MRYILSFTFGKDIDKESGHSHITHVMANVFIDVISKIQDVGIKNRYLVVLRSNKGVSWKKTV